jgi:predicted nucleotidyltransferase
MVQQLVATLDPDRVYLFGWQARGDIHAESDYDFMVVVPHADRPGYELAQLAHEALREFPVSKDVLVWQRAQFDKRLHLVASLPATIVREGRLMYER